MLGLSRDSRSLVDHSGQSILSVFRFVPGFGIGRGRGPSGSVPLLPPDRFGTTPARNGTSLCSLCGSRFSADADAEL